MSTKTDPSEKLDNGPEKHLTWPGLLRLVAGCREPGEPLAAFLLRTIEVCPQCAENCGTFRDLIDAGELAREDFDLPRLAMAYSRLRCRPLWERLHQAEPYTIAEALADEPPRWAMVDYLVRKSVNAPNMDTAEELATLAFEIAQKLPVVGETPEPIPQECDEVPLPQECKHDALCLAAAARGLALRALGRYLEASDCFEYLAEPLDTSASPLGLAAPALVLRAVSCLWQMQPIRTAEWLDSAKGFHRVNRSTDDTHHQHAIWIEVYRLRALICVDPLELAAGPDVDLRSPTLAARELLAAHPPEALPEPLAIAVCQACAEALLVLPPLGLAELPPVLGALETLSQSEEDKALLCGLQGRHALLTGNTAQALETCDLAVTLWWDLERPYRILCAYVDLAAAQAQAGQAHEIPRILNEALIIAADARLHLDSLALLKSLADDPNRLPIKGAEMHRHLHIHQILEEPLPMFEVAP